MKEATSMLKLLLLFADFLAYSYLYFLFSISLTGAGKVKKGNWYIEL